MRDRDQRQNRTAGGKAVVDATVAMVPVEVVPAATVEPGRARGAHGARGAHKAHKAHEARGAAGDAGPREEPDDGCLPLPSPSYVTRKLSLPLMRRRPDLQGSEAQPSSGDAAAEDAEFTALRLTFSSPAMFPGADSEDGNDKGGDSDGKGDSDGNVWADGRASGRAGQDDDDRPDDSAEAPDAAPIGRLRAGLRQAQDEVAAQRRRGEQERDDLARSAKSEVIGEILPVLDDLERASTQVPARLRDDPWAMGVLMIGHSVRALLERQGVERIAPWQGLFDPRLHDAVSRVHDPAVPANTVTDVYRPGYVLHGRVLRPAQVQVAVTQPVEREEDR